MTLTTPPKPQSVNHMEVVRERTRQPVNEFLEQHHPLGSVPGWKACFSARYEGFIVAVIVIGRPISRYNDDGTEASIIRFARRPDRPTNTGTWLISRARKWCALEGFDTLAAHAGVAGNKGTVYEAAGFECTKTSTGSGNSWIRRDREDRGSEEYERKKWVYELCLS